MQRAFGKEQGQGHGSPFAGPIRRTTANPEGSGSSSLADVRSLKPYARARHAAQQGHQSDAKALGLQGFKTPRRPVTGSQEAAQSPAGKNPAPSTPATTARAQGGGGLLRSVTRLLPRPFSWFSPSAPSPSSTSEKSEESPQQQPIAASTRDTALPTRQSRASLGSNLPRSRTTAMNLHSRSSASRLGNATGTIRAQGVQRLSAAGGYASGTPGRAASVISASPSDASRFSGMSGSQSFAFGFGSERRIGGTSAFGGTPGRFHPASSASIAGFGSSPGSVTGSNISAARRSQYQLPISGASIDGGLGRSPLSRRIARSSLGASPLATGGGVYAASEVGGSYSSRLGNLARRPIGSRAGSVYDPAPSEFGGTSIHSGVSASRRRLGRQSWTALNLNAAARRAEETEGEEMMRMYAAAEAREQAGDQEMQDALHVTASPSLGKRGREDSVSVLGDENMTASARKRRKQMVWDAELGFITEEEVRARQPKPQDPTNPAEHLLSALEQLRTPIGDVRKGAQTGNAGTNRVFAQVSVPVPISSKSNRSSNSVLGGEGRRSIAPYSRAREKSKREYENSALQRSAQPGLRSRLENNNAHASSSQSLASNAGRSSKKPVKQAPAKKQENEDDEDEDYIPDDEEMREDEEEEEEEDKEAEMEAEDEPAVAEPQRRTAFGKVSARSLAQVASQGKSPEQARSQTLKVSGRPQARQEAPSSANARRETPAPSREASLGTSDKGKDNFAVRTDTSASSSRASSLRAAPQKTSRTHASASGRITAWEADEEDDLPDVAELQKITMPSMVFPSGFKFRDDAFGTKSPAPSPGKAKPIAPVEPSQPKITYRVPAEREDAASQKIENTVQAEPASSQSLLSRMGGFADAEQKNDVKGLPAAKRPIAALPAPELPSQSVSRSQSVSKSSAAAPVPSKPTFGFTTSEASPFPSTFDKSASSNDVFGKHQQREPAGTVKETEPSKGGMPTFFASAVSKSAQKDSTQKSEFKPLFSFDAAADGERQRGASVPKSTFSFGPPTGAKSTADLAQPAGTSTPTFSFGKPASASHEAPKESKESKAAASTPANSGSSFSFNKPNAETSVSAPSFSFGKTAPSTSAPGSSDEKPTVNGNLAPDKATTRPPFSFGAPSGPAATSSGSASSAAPATASSSNAGAFTFGQPAPAAATKKTPPTGTAPLPSDLMDESPSGVPSAPPTSTTPSFSFGAPAATLGTSQPSPSFGANGAAPASPAGGFSFGAPSGSAAPAPSSSMPSFTFGNASSPATSVAAPSNGTPSFAFGQPSSTNFGAAPAFGSQPAAAAGTSAPFNFGSAPNMSQSNSASSATSQPTFGFAGTGQASTPPSAPSTPTSGAFNFNVGSGAPSMPSAAFQFGASSTPSGAQTPPGNSSGGFSFNMGAAPSSASAPQSPGGRKVKGLPTRTRRG